MKKILLSIIAIVILIPAALSQGTQGYPFVGPGMHYGSRDAYKKTQTAYGRHLRTYASNVFAGCRTEKDCDKRSKEWCMAAYGFETETFNITSTLRMSSKGMAHPFIYHVSYEDSSISLSYIGVSLLIEPYGTNGIKITALSDDPDENIELRDETTGDVSYAADGCMLIAGGGCRQIVRGKSGISMVIKDMTKESRKRWCGGGNYNFCVESDRIKAQFPGGTVKHCVSFLYYEEGDMIRDWYLDVNGEWDIDVPFYDLSDPRCPYEGGYFGTVVRDRPNKWRNQTQNVRFKAY